MLRISYRKLIPYSFAVVLEQYFDYEHIAHVHPTTLGEYVLVENTGKRIVYDQKWPADRKNRRATSRVVQTFIRPETSGSSLSPAGIEGPRFNLSFVPIPAALR